MATEYELFYKFGAVFKEVNIMHQDILHTEQP